MPLTITFDLTGVLYIQFRNSVETCKTIEIVKDAIYADVDADQNVIGVEVLKPGLLGLNILQEKLSEEYALPEYATKIDFSYLDRFMESAVCP